MSHHKANYVRKYQIKPLNINDLFRLKEILFKGPNGLYNEGLSADEHLLFQEKMEALRKIREEINKVSFLHLMRSLLIANDFYKIKEPFIQIELLDIL